VPASTGGDSENDTDPLRQLLSWDRPDETSGIPAGSASVSISPAQDGPEPAGGPGGGADNGEVVRDTVGSPPAGSVLPPLQPASFSQPPHPERERSVGDWSSSRSGWTGYAYQENPRPDYGQADYGQRDYVQRAYGPVQPDPATWPRPDWPQAEQPVAKVPRRPPRSLPGWLGVAIVAAVVGALAGSSVAALFTNRSPETIVREYFPGKAGTVKAGDVQSILASVLPAVVSIDTSSFRDINNFGDYVQGAGTGMIVEPSGVILTNNHVIEGAQSVTVSFYGQVKRYPARVIGADAEKDIALVQVEGAGDSLPVVHLGDSNSAQQGDGVLAIGNALALAGGPTVTEGIVSALDRSLTATTDAGTTERLTGLLQTDAPINPGNSGGPLVNSAGQVVAMNTAVATSSQGNAPAQNVGFGIAVNEIRSVATEILGHPIVP
jgi:S1-C subfamily serine protease